MTTDGIVLFVCAIVIEIILCCFAYSLGKNRVKVDVFRFTRISLDVIDEMESKGEKDIARGMASVLFALLRTLGITEKESENQR